MKIVMNKTATATHSDGTEYVFGPEGREYLVDDGLMTKEMAESLLKDKSADWVDKSEKQTSSSSNKTAGGKD